MSLENLVETLQTADASEATEFIGDTFDSIAAVEDDETWQEKTGLMLASVIPALIWQRENEDISFDTDTVEEHFAFENIVRLSRQSDIPQPVQENLIEYLTYTPEYDDGMFDDEGNFMPGRAEDAQTPIEHHQYILRVFFNALDL